MRKVPTQAYVHTLGTNHLRCSKAIRHRITVVVSAYNAGYNGYNYQRQTLVVKVQKYDLQRGINCQNLFSLETS